MKRGLLVVALLGIGLTANGDVAQDVLQCESIEDNLDRLTCYDRITSESKRVETVVQPEPTETAVKPKPADTAEAAPKRAESVVESKPAESVVEPTRDSFGYEQLGVSKQRRVERITATIARVEKLSRGNHQLTLDDGQVWREIEYDVKTKYDVGDEVVIKRALFGGYNLVSGATGHSNKVHRIK